MKKCPYCAEEIQDEAIKCRFCGEFLDAALQPQSGKKWYYSTISIVLALLVAGPFALPLVWKNPNYNITTKAVITAVIFILTIGLFLLLVYVYTKYMQTVLGPLNEFGY